MMSLVLTAIILLFMAFSFFWRARIVPTDNAQFMSKNQTDTLKGLCAMVVVMVHFPVGYQNTLQDSIGSFAYVAVTFFFLFSAYGMQWSLSNKHNYLKHFWRGRLVSLLLPPILINIIFCVVQSLYIGSFQTGTLIYANNYVVVLLEYCLLFYVVMTYCRLRHVKSLKWALFIMSVVILTSSLLLFFLTIYVDGRHGTMWCIERIGLIWGLLLFVSFDNIKKWMGKSTVTKLFIFAILSVIFGILYIKGYKNVFFWGDYLLKISLGLSLVVTILLLVRRLEIGNKITRFLGSISYEIYLSHAWVMVALAHYFPALSSGEFILLTYFITISLSWLVHKVVVRIRPFFMKEVGKEKA